MSPETTTRKRTLAPDLRQTLRHLEGYHTKNLPTEIIPRLVPRSDEAKKIAAEESFVKWSIALPESGEKITFSLAFPAAPHIKSTEEIEKVKRAGEQIFGERFKLPENLQDKAHLPKDVVFWWLPENDDNQCNLTQLYQMGQVDRQATYQELEKAITQSIAFIKELGGSASIWASFGYKEADEASLGRGQLSVKDPHGHVVDFDPQAWEVVFGIDTNPAQILKFIAPWEELIFEEFGESTNSALQRLTEKLNLNAQVKLVNEVKKLPNGAITIQKGHRITFDTGATLTDTLALLTEILGPFDKTYRAVLELYEKYHKSLWSKEESDKVRQKIIQNLSAVGFPEKETERLTNFILKIRPTMGQLKKWEKEVILEKEGEKKATAIRKQITVYEKASRLKELLPEDPLMRQLVESTIAGEEPENRALSTVLAGSLTGCWLISDYETTEENQITVKAIDIYFGAGSTKSSERFIGAQLIR